MQIVISEHTDVTLAPPNAFAPNHHHPFFAGLVVSTPSASNSFCRASSAASSRVPPLRRPPRADACGARSRSPGRRFRLGAGNGVQRRCGFVNRFTTNISVRETRRREDDAAARPSAAARRLRVPLPARAPTRFRANFSTSCVRCLVSSHISCIQDEDEDAFAGSPTSRTGRDPPLAVKSSSAKPPPPRRSETRPPRDAPRPNRSEQVVDVAFDPPPRA